jgi:hypothetical protein
MRDIRRGLGAAIALVGIAAMVFAIQTADEGQPEVTEKVQVAHWLETELLVNTHILLIGSLVLLIGSLYLAATVPRVWRYALITLSFLVFAAAAGIFVVWGNGLGWNIMGGFPQ